MRDDEIDQAAVHQLDDASAEPRRRHRAGHRQADGRVVLGRQHLVGEDAHASDNRPALNAWNPSSIRCRISGLPLGPVVAYRLCLTETSSGGSARCAPGARCGKGCGSVLSHGARAVAASELA